MIFLIPFCWAMLFAISWRRCVNAASAAFAASTVLVAWLLVVTEVFSLFHLLKAGPIQFVWIFSAGMLLMVSLRKGALAGLREEGSRLCEAMRKNKIFTAIISVLGVSTFGSGLFYPPNNWDSLTYHLPRVMHWIANGSVEYFATSNPRQNYQMPLAEFVLTHLQLLSGSDRWFFSLQWFAWAHGIGASWAITRLLGGDIRARRFASIFAATLPMGVLQASSTQNDLVLSAGCFLVVWYFLQFAKQASCANAVGIGLSIGMCLATKGTAYVYVPAISLPLVGLVFWHGGGRRRAIFMKLTAAAFIALSMNAGIYARNVSFCGMPLPQDGDKYRNEAMSISILASNLARNAALHMGTPLSGLNGKITAGILDLLGASARDPRATLGSTPFAVQPLSLHEDFAGNPLHLFLLTFALACLGSRRLRSSLPSLAIPLLGMSIILMIFLFSLLFKWQVWGSRLQLPIFLLSAPFVGWVVTRIFARDAVRFVPRLFLLAQVTFALPFAYSNQIRPLIPRPGTVHPWDERASLYFANRPDLRIPSLQATAIIRQQKTLACVLVSGIDDFEYPFWILTGVRLNHADVWNDSDKLDPAPSGPGLVLVIRPSNEPISPLPASVVLYDSPLVRVLKTEKLPSAKRPLIPE